MSKFLDLDGLSLYDSKIKDTYLKKSGGTMTGPLTVNSGESRFYAANTVYTDPDPQVACAIKVIGKVAATDYVKALSLISTVPTGTAPLKVSSTTMVNNLNADRVDGYHANGLLTGVSISGAHNNTVNVTVGGVTKSAAIYPHSKYGTRYILKTDNGGRATMFLIADITSLKDLSQGGGTYGFTGHAIMSRDMGAINNADYSVDITARCAWASTANVLKTSHPGKLRPMVVDYGDKRYIAISVLGSAARIMLTGWWHNCLAEFTELMVPTDSSLPEGVTVVTNHTNGTGYLASQAVTLLTPRYIWGQSFDGSSDITGSLHNVGSIYASGEIRSTAGNAFRATSGNYGVFLRNDGTNFYIMQTASGDSNGNWNSYRPFQLNFATGKVTIGSVLCVKDNESVGVGTSTPSAKFDVNGSFIATTGEFRTSVKSPVFVSALPSSISLPAAASTGGKTLLESTIGIGDHFIAVTKTWGENGAFMQIQNGKKGYEFRYIPIGIINGTADQSTDPSFSLLKFTESNQISIGDESKGSDATVHGALTLHNPITGAAVTLTVNQAGRLVANGSVIPY